MLSYYSLGIHFPIGDTFLKGSENCVLLANILEHKLCVGVKDKKIKEVGVCFLGTHNLGTSGGAELKAYKNFVQNATGIQIYDGPFKVVCL